MNVLSKHTHAALMPVVWILMVLSFASVMMDSWGMELIAQVKYQFCEHS